MEQADLVERCKLGDMDAFNVLYERYSVKALHTAYLITGRRETAEDVVQETFVHGRQSAFPKDVTR